MAVGVMSAATMTVSGARSSNGVTRQCRASQAQVTSLAASKTPIAATQQAFITRAMQTNLAEEQVGKLAQQKGATQQAKSLGQMLTNDHQANQQKADQVAKQMGVTPPTSPSAMQKSDYDRLSKLSGAAFDRQFAAMMVEGHRKAISEFRREERMKGAVGQYAKQTRASRDLRIERMGKGEHAGRGQIMNKLAFVALATLICSSGVAMTMTGSAAGAKMASCLRYLSDRH